MLVKVSLFPNPLEQMLPMNTKNALLAAVCSLALTGLVVYAADDKKPAPAEDADKKDTSFAGNKKVEEIIKTFKGKGAMVTVKFH